MTLAQNTLDRYKTIKAVENEWHEFSPYTAFCIYFSLNTLFQIVKPLNTVVQILVLWTKFQSLVLVWPLQKLPHKYLTHCSVCGSVDSLYGTDKNHFNVNKDEKSRANKRHKAWLLQETQNIWQMKLALKSGLGNSKYSLLSTHALANSECYGTSPKRINWTVKQV